MKSTNRREYTKLLQTLITHRKNIGQTQEELATTLGITQANVSKIESGEIRLDIVQLLDWCNAISLPLEQCLIGADLITATTQASQNADTVAIPIDCADNQPSGATLVLRWNQLRFNIPLAGTTAATYRQVESAIVDLFRSLNGASSGKLKNRDAISRALKLAIESMPTVNPSDIYHHIVYRLYLREYRRSDPAQSWVRAGGEAVELFFKEHYAPLLRPYGIDLKLAFETGVSNQFLTEMGIADQVPGDSKLDICLYGNTGENRWVPFAGVHSKASLAERVSDDKPCSEKMMQNGFFSYLFTFDAKSFPPPTGNLQNDGELGSPTAPSDKRRYIEEFGSFSACFSYNLNSKPSGPATTSGKKIYVSAFNTADPFVTVVSNDWQSWLRSKQSA